MTSNSRFASLVAAVALTLIGAQAQAGQASGNLAIGITITSSCALSSGASGQSFHVENHNCDGINSFRVDRESNGVRTEAPLQTNASSDVKGSEATPTVVTLYW
ncbi:hypothetical protein [Pseudomonas sp. GV071]|jgi:hypothetical protein|uniref:hypothetical protein n=1 Tax=Pseudomonas sp. GV071 TaxID=2135754 RepID=UPI000D3825C7|nr:hypothetical protein [Pseudomonas sp. GV071]PTQ72363.1 hypothetical protein C8K61_103294 [Pseudomonas sp. GV071]